MQTPFEVMLTDNSNHSVPQSALNCFFIFDLLTEIVKCVVSLSVATLNTPNYFKNN